MKKLLFIATFLIGLSSFAQDSQNPTKTSDWGKYVSFSASFSNQEGLSTLESGYGCLEAGAFYKNISGGIGIGKNFQEVDGSNSWYIEPRFVWNVIDFTAFKAGLIGGAGMYLNNSTDPFVREYGIGTEVDSDYINYVIQFTNWGTGSSNANYFTVGISKSF